VQLEGLGKLKKFTSSGLEPATFRLVASDAIRLCPIPLFQIVVQHTLQNEMFAVFSTQTQFRRLNNLILDSSTMNQFQLDFR
jgi:hypothetical protein